MHLTPREIDHLKLHQAGALAQKRLARGVKLNAPECVALISTQIMEFIRDGKSVAELMDLGCQMLGRRQVMDGIPSLLHDIQIEGCFPDGTKLVTVHNPISQIDGNMELALYGSFLPLPSLEIFGELAEEEFIPGEILTMEGTITLNQGRDKTRLQVTNLGDRPIQVGSHYHLIESNLFLEFDRRLAYGFRLDVPAGTAIRFEPGDSKTVPIVRIAGNQIISGGNNLASGKVNSKDGNDEKILQNVIEKGFSHAPALVNMENQNDPQDGIITRENYSLLYGPTTGDRVRLGDTDLFIEVEKDYAVYGDECVFGGGKVIREGMGQATGFKTLESLETVITNALIVDYTGIYKADIGLVNGRIHAIGKAGNPDVMEGVHPDMIIGVNTDVIAGEGMIVTAGGIDTHVHFICPQIYPEAIASGLTTLIGGGVGPSTGTCATTCTPHPNHILMMLKATDEIPLNIGFTGKGNTSHPAGLQESVDAGLVGLKLHEDWGSTPAAIDNCLNIADENDIQVTIHTDTLNESCCVEQTIAAFKGRAIHTYHSEGAGGGHAPDIITVCGLTNVIPSSTNPTRPFTSNTIDEHLDMLMVCHHLDKNISEDVAFAESRIRGETIAAEDILHDMGAISIISSDAQAMGRIGEVITRTWQTADKMKRQRGRMAEEKGNQNDNFRVKRYIAKYTINPALAHGISHVVGSIEVGKLADLVLWKPALFGAKPEAIIKGGFIVWSQMGDANASIPTPQPVYMKSMYAANGKAASSTSYSFVSRSCITKGIGKSYELQKPLEAVQNCRSVTKKDMKLNDFCPKINIDPETYEVVANGEHLSCSPVDNLSLAQKYFLF